MMLVASAQDKKTLSGTVSDATGAVIGGARVSIVTKGQETGGQEQLSAADGSFSFLVLPGLYQVKAAHHGFISTTQEVNTVQSSDSKLSLVLRLAPVHESMSIVESSDYVTPSIQTATKTLTPLRDVPQAITVVTQTQVRDQMMMSIADVVQYIPGITAHQGENNRDQLVIRGNQSSADFFLNGVRDDVQYFRDLYNVDRVEALKGPNAMTFGRGGGGGVVNRVTKEAGNTPLREVTMQGGSFGNRRFTADFDQPLGDRWAVRLNSMYENSDSFRDYVNLERFAINPTASFTLNAATRVTMGYEHYRDNRVGDRGIPSYQGLPADIAYSTYFGNPADGSAKSQVHMGSASVDHQAGRWNIRNRTLIADYDRFYQNYVPGSVNAAMTLVGMSAYNNVTQRRNMFNQTDVSSALFTGAIRHTVATGAEFGRQMTGNFRNTGYFANNATSILIPFANPVMQTRAAFRQSATDANNDVKTNLGAVYVQDQMELSRYVQVLAGLRFDHFDLQYQNLRNGENLRRIDNLLSPRLGVVLKPVNTVSVYSSYSISWLPSSGDQFASLTTLTQQLKPEKFTNLEFGVKWDVNRNLAFTSAVYRLDRTNTRSVDPNDPTRILQTGRQRSEGIEVGVAGSLTRFWRITGAYAWQDAFITNATAAAPAGARVAQVPQNTFSLWNNYQVLKRMGVGLGILNRSDMFAGIDNTVVLPGYVRADVAVYYSLTDRMRLQANVENVTNRDYVMNANSNNNIQPGFPRAVRVGLIARF